MSASFQSLTERLTRLLWIVFAIDVVALVFDLWERIIAFQMRNGAVGDAITAAASASDNRQMVIGYLQLGFFITTAVIAAVWIRRANMNARLLGAREMRFTPNWSIGWYFVPIANLFMPYQSMAETWRASSGRPDWKNEPVPDFLKYWWALWLAANIVGQIAAQLYMKVSDPESLILGNTAYLVADGISAVLDLVFLQLVQQLSERQAQTAPRKHS
ncbi:DUF4328 domain-containing protein [Mesorhizobium sp. RP14(2022)]|uniref:DUF4328 domain-containing protein n=1 Tax=Mesorhizobium liriopis TaxID=2953882 RepID=A0ABT1C1Y3_9HYPH|nr:DUF4328 domain-containing protein [Mesorhizobium liriopis]MCO6048518.1 DUF4328 domain-containing protein [Mesorhizobium liriopis]